ncbi:single-stranded-DNA-specific exonuclease RecJ [Candidatus Nomurabacteria bacterium]|nr:single-stranded-DNA-specific exonuclease RecJ [Candidatus Nomurabacteria bacterium]
MKSYRVRERLHEQLLPHLMLSRGIALDAHESFLTPNFERDSHDPFLLPDMGVAVERIMAAKQSGEKVAVWSDYDCDGIPGGVLLTEFFRAIGIDTTHYIPDRHAEGYGLNNEGLATLAQAGVTLVVTVDLGTTDVEPIAFAKTKGIDVIITDHHLEPAQLPEALAIINPKLKTSQYPFDGLCGAGVAWKLAQAIQQKHKLLGEGQEKWMLDLAALGTLSDMVPLVGENRMIAHYGLVVMRKMRRPGLSSLFRLLRIKSELLTEDDIGFMIAPRINAASRMGTPRTAAQLLGEQDKTIATGLAKELQALNDERKGLVAATVKEVNKRLAMGVESSVIVMGSPSWRPGILGLVANNVAETYGKPVFLWGREGGELMRGSVRGAPGINVVELMAGARDVFEDFGGHTASGGFSLTQERVHELPMRLAAAYESIAQKGLAQNEVLIDRELDMAEVSFAHRELKKLAPFGIGNQKPLFVVPRVTIGNAKMFGKAQEHLDLRLTNGSTSVSGISFFAKPSNFTKQISVGDTADVVGHVETDWRGQPRIRVVDVL